MSTAPASATPETTLSQTAAATTDDPRGARANMRIRSSVRIDGEKASPAHETGTGVTATFRIASLTSIRLGQAAPAADSSADRSNPNRHA